MIPDSTFWWRLILLIGAETACIVLAARAATRYAKSATVSRLIWRTAIVCLLLVTVSGFTGAGQMVAHQLAALRPASHPQPSVVLEKQVSHDVATSPVITSSISLPEVSPAKINFWPGVVWLFGFVAVVTRIMLAGGLLVYLRYSRKTLRDSKTSEQLSKIVERFGIRRHVRLIESTEVAALFTFGILRPVIVVPAQFADRFSPEQRDVIFTHELAHVTAWDSLWHFLADATSAALWWNPFVWLARRQLHDAAEIAADEAVATLENGAVTLADCLVAMARHTTSRWRWSRLGMTGNGSALKRRVERLLTFGVGHSLPTTWRMRLFQLGGAVLASAVVFLVCGWAQDKNPVNDGKFGEPLAPLSVISRAVAGKEPHRPDLVAEMLKDAKAMYDIGNLAEAMRELTFVLMANPTNKEAYYYMDLIRESKYRDRVEKREGNFLNWNQPWLLPTLPPKRIEPGHKPVPLSVQDSPITAGRAVKVLPAGELEAYMDILRSGGQVRLADNRTSSSTPAVPKKQQPADDWQLKSFKFDFEVVSKNLQKLGRNSSDEHAALVKIFGERGVDFSGTNSAGDVKAVKVVHPDRILVLASIADMKVIEQVLAELNTVEITSRAEQIYSKQFYIDKNTLIQTLKDEGYAVSDSTTMHQAFKQWLKTKGVDLLDPGKSVYYNETRGLLLVRGTLSDLEYIDLAIQTIGKIQSQLAIECEIAQVSGDPEKLLKRLNIDPKIAQIWSPVSWHKLIEALKAEPGVEVLKAPKVTTLSERTAYVETANELADGRKTGVAVTVLPKVSTDAFSVDLTAIYARGTTKDKNSRLPSRGEAHATVTDHATLVFVCADSESPNKMDVVFVTPTIIDPAGNQVHTDEQIEARIARP